MGFSDLDIDAIIDELVHQFADPLAFFRELVQNAIDAGSGEIEIDIVHETPDEGPPRAEITVRDWGEGMTREIIEEEFLRLFSSGKAEDLTKIGRFGIGFVSVFAIAPDAVVVETGRHGEYWRVVFSDDRRWELYELDLPVEGTSIRIFKTMGSQEFDDFYDAARNALDEWCHHARIPVRFEGRDLRREFDVSSKATIEHREEGTRIVMGMREEPGGAVGYYNRGLTLWEGRESAWPWVTYKIDSRYLEHTLTRDRLLADDHFSKASSLLRTLAEDRLPAALIDELENHAAADETSPNYALYCRYLAHYLTSGRAFRVDWRDRPIFRTLDGRSWTAHEIRALIRDGDFYRTRLDDVFVGGVDETCHVVDASGPARVVEEAFGTTLPLLEEHFFIPRALETRHPDKGGELRDVVISLLETGGWMPGDVSVATSDLLPSRWSQRMAVVIPSTDRTLVPVDRGRRPGLEVTLDALDEQHRLVINVDFETIQTLIETADREPEWAGYVLLDGLFAPADSTLARHATRHRLERTGEKP